MLITTVEKTYRGNQQTKVHLDNGRENAASVNIKHTESATKMSSKS